jgi:spermidine synthase
VKNANYANEWFLDSESEHKLILHRTKQQIASVQTPFQQAKIIDTYTLGRILVLDNKIQSAEADEFVYHEALVHPAMVLHGNPRSVLVLGGGEGATLREVLRYKSVSKVTMVDIDKDLVKLCEKHLTKWHAGAFKDPRVTLVFDYAMKYVKHTKDKFDVIIMDINDPVEGGPAALIYTREFFASLKKLLTVNGTFVTQAIEIFYDESDLHSILHNTLASVYKTAESYCEYIPSFSSMWGFVLCSQSDRKASQLAPENVDEITGKLLKTSLRYYDGMAHQRLFSLPKFVRESIGKQTKVSTIATPLNVFAGV